MCLTGAEPVCSTANERNQSLPCTFYWQRSGSVAPAPKNNSWPVAKDNHKERNMNRLLIGTAAAVLLGLTPALAADDFATQPPTQSGRRTLMTLPSRRPSQSWAAPTLRAARLSKAQRLRPLVRRVPTRSTRTRWTPSSGSADQSTGAKEQSSAPHGSSAADTSKPNPTLGDESSKE